MIFSSVCVSNLRDSVPLLSLRFWIPVSRFVKNFISLVVALRVGFRCYHLFCVFLLQFFIACAKSAVVTAASLFIPHCFVYII